MPQPTTWVIRMPPAATHLPLYFSQSSIRTLPEACRYFSLARQQITRTCSPRCLRTQALVVGGLEDRRGNARQHDRVVVLDPGSELLEIGHRRDAQVEVTDRAHRSNRRCRRSCKAASRSAFHSADRNRPGRHPYQQILAPALLFGFRGSPSPSASDAQRPA